MIAKSDQKTVINRDHFQMTFYGISLVEENENVYSGIRITFRNSMENNTFEVLVKFRRCCP